MKNIFKISVVLFIGLSLVVSSCKKEEADLLGCTDSTALNYNSLANTDNGSCIPFIYGCMDVNSFNYDSLANTNQVSETDLTNPCTSIVYGCMDNSAMNYSSYANSDDGSCIFAYGIAQGQWDIETACEDLSISIPFFLDTLVPLNDLFPNSIEIMGVGEGVVSLDINGSAILADIANDGAVTIQDDQKISLNTGDFGILDVGIEGSGNIETSTNGNLTLYLTIVIPATTTNVPSCEITFSK